MRIGFEVPSASTEYTLKYIDVPSVAVWATRTIDQRPPTISVDVNEPGRVVNVPIKVFGALTDALTFVDAPGSGICNKLPVAGATTVGESKYKRRPALIPLTP